jgi:hypothetical protein
VRFLHRSRLRSLTVTAGILFSILPLPASGAMLGGSEIVKIVGDITTNRHTMLCQLSLRAQEGLTASEVASALGPLKGYARSVALQCLARKMASELGGTELTAILGPENDDEQTLEVKIFGNDSGYRQRMLCTLKDHVREGITASELASALGPLTGYARSVALQCLAPKLSSDLDGPELVAVLGPQDVDKDVLTTQIAGTDPGYRQRMLCTMKSHVRERISAGEVASALGPLTGLARSRAIDCLAPRLVDGLTGAELIEITGIDTAYRPAMLCTLADHAMDGINADEVEQALESLTNYDRARAVQCLKPRVQWGLTGAELAKIFGEGTRYRSRMICTLKNHARVNMSGSDLSLALGDITGYARNLALRCLENLDPIGVCGSTALQRSLVPEYVCFGIEGGTYPYAPVCATLSVLAYQPVYFGYACSLHDECYSTPTAPKSDCDARFLSLLKGTCDETLRGSLRALSRWSCHNAVSEYHHQVRVRGCNPYLLAQLDAGNGNAVCD